MTFIKNGAFRVNARTIEVPKANNQEDAHEMGGIIMNFVKQQICFASMATLLVIGACGKTPGIVEKAFWANKATGTDGTFQAPEGSRLLVVQTTFGPFDNSSGGSSAVSPILSSSDGRQFEQEGTCVAATLAGCLPFKINWKTAKSGDGKMTLIFIVPKDALGPYKMSFRDKLASEFIVSDELEEVNADRTNAK